MKRLLLLVIAGCICCIQGSAQRRTCLGIESGVYVDKVISSDVDFGYLRVRNNVRGVRGGITLSHELTESIRVETGFFPKNYRVRFRVDDEDYGIFQTQPTNNQLRFSTLNVPFRVYARLPIEPEQFYFTFVTGFIYSSHNVHYGGRDTLLYGDSLSYRYSTYIDRRGYALFQAGIGCEIALGKNLWLNLTTSCIGGFRNMAEINVEYLLADGTVQRGNILSTGDYLDAAIAIRYMIGSSRKRNGEK
jgi:hypothetical protein